LKSQQELTVYKWTPGHCEIDGNEKADKVARETVNNNNNNPMAEISTYSSLALKSQGIPILPNLFTSLLESEWQRTPNKKFR